MITSTIKLYKNSLFFAHQNYKIDDIELFLAKLPVLTVNKAQEVKTRLNNKILLTLPIYDNTNILDVKKYNYVKIINQTFQDEVSSIVSIDYYFVNSVIAGSDNVFTFELVLDVLNTFIDKLIFSPRTFVIREHVNRFYGKTEYNDDVYLLKKIDNNFESFPDQLEPVKNFRLLSDPDYNNFLTSFWVKIIYKKNDRLFSCFLPYEGSNFKVYFRNIQNPITIQSFKNYLDFGNTYFSGLFSDVNCWSISIIPYAPIDELKNFYQTDVVINLENVKAAFLLELGNGINTIAFDFNEVILEPLTEVRLNLLKNGQVQTSIDEYLGNLLIVKISKTQFNNFYNFERPKARYFNDPILLNSSFFKLLFSYGSFQYRLTFDNIKFDNPDIGLIIFDQSAKRFVDLKYLTNFSVQKGGTFYVNDGNYTKILNFTNAYNFEDYGEMPLFSDKYRDYLDSGNYYLDKAIFDNSRDVRYMQYQDTIQSQKLSTDMGYLSAFSSILIGLGLGSPRAIASGIKQGASTYFSQFSHQHQNQIFDKENLINELNYQKNINDIKFNNLSIKNAGNFESVLNTNRNNNFQLQILSIPQKIKNKLDNYYYYYGYEINDYKVPLHNNRIFFDYLKCKPEFVNYNIINDNNIMAFIIEKLNNGVTFIHHYKNSWYFDFEIIENIEVNI